MQKIGILAGTFDPIHNGQLQFARQACRQLGLDRVYLLVEAGEGEAVLDRRHRLNMAWLAIVEDPHLALLPMEQANFTTQDTLPWLNRQFPGNRVYFLLDEATFDRLHLRPDFDELQRKVVFVVNQPTGSGQTDTPLAYHRITTNLAHLKAEAIRSLEHSTWQSFVPKNVARYIESHQIYEAVPSL